MAIFTSTMTQLFFLLLSLAPLNRTVAGDRRALHESLIPINWDTPPAPLLDAPTNPPPAPDLPTTIVTPANPANISALSSDKHRASSVVKNTVVGVAVTMTLLGVLSASFLLLYRRLRRGSPESEKLVAGGQSRPPNGRLSAAAPEVLYLGTVAPAVRSGEQQLSESPYRKLRSSSAAHHQPSPELRPLPPLVPQPRQPMMLSDDDVYYTPNRSASSAVSGSPSSVTTSRQSPAAAVGKDITVCVVDNDPKSRRSSPRSRLSNLSSSDVKRVVPQSPKAPPPPPPPLPPPPRPKHEKSKIPPLMAIFPITKEIVTDFPVPARPLSSRRQWANPISRDDALVPVAEKPFIEPDEKPKLKPLHWDKVRASSDHEMVWDQLKSSSFQLDEDMFASLFRNSTNGASKEAVRKPAVPPSRLDNRVLDPKKSQNIAILLRVLNVTIEEVTEALLEGNPEGLGDELLETLVKMAPTKEEELRLRDYAGDISKLGSAERFLKAMLGIPFAFKRVDAMVYRANFDAEVDYLRKSFKTLEVACEELKGSRLFLKLLEAVLRTGNRMNVGTKRGEAKAFKLDTLLKLADVKGIDGKTTLLHFVVQEIIRSEGSSSDHATDNNPPDSYIMKEEDFRKQGLKVVAGLGKELANVKRAAGMDADVLSSYVSKLESGLDKIKSVLQLGRVSTQGRFFEYMRTFLGEAEDGISRIKAEEKTALALVKEITEYFHGSAAREEAHPFRIFMVVRDFLSMLDNVCREVERMQAAAVVGSARSFRMLTSASLPVLSRFDSKRGESSGDESSSS